MKYSLMNELEVAAYNKDSKIQGYCYKMCENFVNNHNLTKEQLEEINTNSPALESFITITPEMKKAKIKLEETIKAKIEAMNYERGMAK